MAGDDPCLLGVQAKELADPSVDILMAGAVEAVFPHAILPAVFLGDGVEIGLGPHGHVEGGVEDGHVGDAGEILLAGLNAPQVGGIVEGAQDEALADACLHRLVHQGRLGELHSAMENPVPDGADFGKVGDDAHLGVGHLGADGGQGLAVPLDVEGLLLLLALGLVGQFRPLHADSFHQPLAQDGLVRHVEEGEFQGGTAGIDDQDFQGNGLQRGEMSGGRSKGRRGERRGGGLRRGQAPRRARQGRTIPPWEPSV